VTGPRTRLDGDFHRLWGAYSVSEIDSALGAGALPLIAVLVLALLTGVGLAVGYAMGMGEGDQVANQIGGQLSYLPGVLLVTGVAVAVVGLLPRWSLLAWAGVAFVFFQAMLGETLRLPGWLDGVSPFWHLPRLPVESFSPLPAVAELVLTAALVFFGVWGCRRRDVTGLAARPTIDGWGIGPAQARVATPLGRPRPRVRAGNGARSQPGSLRDTRRR